MGSPTGATMSIIMMIIVSILFVFWCSCTLYFIARGLCDGTLCAKRAKNALCVGFIALGFSIFWGYVAAQLCLDMLRSV